MTSGSGFEAKLSDAMFGKRPSELKPDDIQRIVDEQILEGAEIELKATLPAKKGNNPWIDGKGRTGDHARNELIAEVIAFANAYGGTLLVGIEESKTKPARASAITPIPDCAELAERLRLQCRDCIEPQLPVLEVEGVPLADDGAGIVVFQAPRSRMAPHRHTATKECYIRRADRTEKMTMREIQDLTLQVDRGLAAIDAVFERRHQTFSDKVVDFVRGVPQGFGLRVTAFPTTPLYVDRVHGNDAVLPPMHNLSATFSNGQAFDLYVPDRGHSWRPILRATQLEGWDGDYGTVREVHRDGLIEYQLFTKIRAEGERFYLFVQWIMGLVTNAMCAVEKFRRAADAPAVEYALDVAISVPLDPVPVGIYGRDSFGRHQGPFPSGETHFPRLGIGSPEEFQQIAALFERDFWNAAGVDVTDSPEIDFERAFRELGITDDDGAS